MLIVKNIHAAAFAAVLRHIRYCYIFSNKSAKRVDNNEL